MQANDKLIASEGVSSINKFYQVVAEENDFFVIYKKPDVLVHAGGEGADPQTQTLVDALRAEFGMEVYPCHRLDKGTSGLMLIAKSVQANSVLSQAFAERLIEKQYLAITDKRPKKKQGTVKGDMLKARNGSWRLARTVENPAITRFNSIGLGDGKRLILLNPTTGRTHQLRVALKSLSSPILGDNRYGGMASDRLYLHSYKLKFLYCGKEFQYTSSAHEGRHFLETHIGHKIKEILNNESVG